MKPEAIVKKLVDEAVLRAVESAAAKFFRPEAERQILLAKAK